MSGRPTDAATGTTQTNAPTKVETANEAATETDDDALVGGYGIVAEIRLAHPDLILAPTIDAVSEVTVRPDVQGYTPESPLYVTVSGDEFERFESALSTDNTVFSPTLVDRSAGRRVYAVEPQRESIVLSTVFSTDAYLVEMRSGNAGWILRMRVPSRATLSALRDRMRDEDVTFEVRRILDVDSAADESEDTLTGRQRDVLLTAFHAGYYEVPRECTQSELAEGLDVSTAAVSQRVRRATKRLLETTDVAAPSEVP